QLEVLALAPSTYEVPVILAPTTSPIVDAPTKVLALAIDERVLGHTALAPQRVYTFLDLVPVLSAHTTHVCAPQRVFASQVPAKSLEQTLNSIAFEQVHVPISYQHHLLSHNTKSNSIKLFGDSSRSVHCNKYTHWIKEGHRSFVLGLEKYEHGGWKNISKKFVPTKTPTQVASHAQKYFERKKAPKKEKKRRSIHDTTLEDIDMIVTPHIDQHN
ncbi:Transcription factor DIVARICATA, partial [Glycine soja]